MADVVRAEITGLEKTLGKLEKFPGKLQRKWLRKGLREGSTPMLKAIRRNAPRDTGDLKKSLGRRITTSKNNPRVDIGFDSRGFHWHLVEFGTVARYTRTGKSTGTMPARPFVRPAFDAHIQGFFRTLDKAIVEGIRADA